jgi:hypothetical protein
MRASSLCTIRVDAGVCALYFLQSCFGHHKILCQSFKFRAKVVPGTNKRGKGAKAALEAFLRHPDLTYDGVARSCSFIWCFHILTGIFRAQERDAIKALKIEELSSQVSIIFGCNGSSFYLRYLFVLASLFDPLCRCFLKFVSPPLLLKNNEINRMTSLFNDENNSKS